ncbi:MAG: class I SAM-dependent methyltransferase [Firmicutes bacterium]|nr:class I SAM-dependent methyltransferase [Bacillota bacterium]MBU4554152.1 class I SAM-dependent methyltransferase [Bacillota bacterium]MBV1726808.1 class I SAM-dependent methyltransferase [Desulforudis sp.]MBV1735793.1 class I SAM-dependent methyltransferase [Desulforudis sp.]MBV1770543.1 class I SAM-dependent methyltransferase [Desulforudis sp.]
MWASRKACPLELTGVLGARLRKIAGLVPSDSRLADIGTDHALLPLYLVQKGICPQVIGVEKAPGPLQAALRAVSKSGLERYIDVREGDGLEPIAPGEVNAVVIAGMGGQTIANVLERAPQGVLIGVRSLVLQPMNRGAALREWLYGHGWPPVGEELVDESGRLYEIIAAKPGQREAVTPDEILLEVGPLLWENRHPLLANHLAELIQKYERMYEGIVRASACDPCKRAEIEARLHSLKEMMKCL